MYRYIYIRFLQVYVSIPIYYFSPEDNALLVNSEELANFKTVRNEMQDSKLN